MKYLYQSFSISIQAVFMAFFSGAIVCLGLSFTYHTVCCHQNRFIGGHIRGNLTDEINATFDFINVF